MKSVRDRADESTNFCTTLGSETGPRTERISRSIDASANPEMVWSSSDGDPESR